MVVKVIDEVVVVVARNNDARHSFNEFGVVFESTMAAVVAETEVLFVRMVVHHHRHLSQTSNQLKGHYHRKVYL